VERLTPYRDRLWDIPGLGEERDASDEDHDPIATEEFHAPQPQHPA
jgi:hypothetical protein